MTLARPTALLAAVLACTGAGAVAALTIEATSGIWVRDVPDRDIRGDGTSRIEWGVGTGGTGPSGYVFEAARGPFEVAPGEEFVLGTFTHHNFPVFPPSLRQADLRLDVTVAGHGRIRTPIPFRHLETPNVGACDFLSERPCADLVSMLAAPASMPFVLGGMRYTFRVEGFGEGDRVFRRFVTQEERENAASVIGRFDAEPAVVPLPAAAALLMGGLAALSALGALRRRRERS